jgi:beta-1,4-mannosyltransferase
MWHWKFFPDYRASNPYQDLLAAALSGNADVHPGTISDALEALALGPVVFHLHWEDGIYAAASTEAAAIRDTEIFLTQLVVFRELGGRLVWTLHNAGPHEDRFPALSARLLRALAGQADVVHVHGHTAADFALGFGVAPERILIVPHPNIALAYPNDISDEAARRYFRFQAHETVFAFLGARRGYKGVDDLLWAFAEVHRVSPAAQLLLAGRQAAGSEARFLAPSPGVRLIPRFVDDGIVQYVLRSADYVVLPYRRILTSGAVALALGFERPVIVPDLAPLLEVVQPNREALVFRAGDPVDLERVMLQACTQNEITRCRLRSNARQTGEAVTFTDLAAALDVRLKSAGGGRQGVSQLRPHRIGHSAEEQIREGVTEVDALPMHHPVIATEI